MDLLLDTLTLSSILKSGPPAAINVVLLYFAKEVYKSPFNRHVRWYLGTNWYYAFDIIKAK